MACASFPNYAESTAVSSSFFNLILISVLVVLSSNLDFIRQLGPSKQSDAESGFDLADICGKRGVLRLHTIGWGDCACTNELLVLALGDGREGREGDPWWWCLSDTN